MAPGGCCAAAVDKEHSVVDYIHVIVSTHCKYHSVVSSVYADSSTVYITLSVCIALQRWYKLNKVQSYDSLHKDSFSFHSCPHVVPCAVVHVTTMYVETGAAAHHTE